MRGSGIKGFEISNLMCQYIKEVSPCGKQNPNKKELN